MFCSMNWINTNLKLVIPLSLVGLIILGGGGYYLYQKNQTQTPANTEAAAKEEVQRRS